MALTVEDGSGLANADSYVSLDDFKAYAASLGKTIDDDDTKLEADLRGAAEFIGERFFGRWRGVQRTAIQALAWPRGGVYLDETALTDPAAPGGPSSRIPVPADAVPALVVRAQCLLAVEAGAGGLWVDTSLEPSRIVTEKKIGPLTTKFAVSSPNPAQQDTFQRIDRVLEPLLVVRPFLTVGRA